MKNKKPLYITLFTLDMAITIALFVISIVMLATMPEDNYELQKVTGFIGYLQKNPTIFLVAIVVPLFVLLIVNMVALFTYVKKTQAAKKVKLTDLTEEQKAALKAELLKDVNKDENN